jgi:hypothetical protein
VRLRGRSPPADRTGRELTSVVVEPSRADAAAGAGASTSQDAAPASAAQHVAPALRQRRPLPAAAGPDPGPAQEPAHRFASLPLWENNPQQQGLRSRYAEWAQEAETKRRNDLGHVYRAGAAGGEDAADAAHPYRSRWSAVSGEVGGKLRAASLDALQTALGSASRSGGSNLLDGLLAPRTSPDQTRIAELDNDLDVRVLSGAVSGGLGALTAEGMANAIDRARAAGGKVSLQATDVNALVPRACPVQVEEQARADGSVAYRFSEKPVSAMVSEEAKLRKTRDNLRLLQTMASGSAAYGALIHPAVAGAAAVARNAAAGNLMNAGGSAGGLAFSFSYLARLGSRGIESLLQMSLTTAQDDLAPGSATQKLPLFKLDRAAPTGPSDQPELPQRLLAEIGQLLRETAAQWPATLGNVAVYGFANATANVASTAVAQMYARDIEDVGNSREAQQYITSSMNDFVWQLIKGRFDGALSNMGAAVDARTANTACRLIEEQTEQLHQLIDLNQRTRSELSALPNARPQGRAGVAHDIQRQELQTRSANCESRMREITAELQQRIDDAGTRLGVPDEQVAQLRARLPPPIERGNPLFTAV